MSKKKKKTEIKGGEISHEETSSDDNAFINECPECHRPPGKWRGPSVLNKAQCPPEVIHKAYAIGFLYNIRALQLTHPLSHSPGAGDSKRQPFDMKITQGSIFQGHNEIQTPQYTGWVGWVEAGSGIKAWGLSSQGGRGWLFIQPAPAHLQGSPQPNLTPDRPKSLHWSKKFSTGQYLHTFPFSGHFSRASQGEQGTISNWEPERRPP